ncbi:MAG: shikimate dehydrogenase [Lachnospiraceae bacterium]|nr:shikimate dehydrogenase [Lachnospiraceae bacterium]
MARYGLIGYPLGHSFSKIIHEQLADYTYDIIPLTKEEFDPFMQGRDFAALNVTLPYKKAVIPYLDELDANAAAIGAVNTIVNENDRLIGHNTDFSGFEYMLTHNHVAIAGKKVLVLGNGGAAQAILAVLKKMNAGEIIIAKPRPSTETITMEECYAHHTDAQIVVNTSPVGMYPHVDESPLDLTRFTVCEAVCDIVYNPLETKLLAQARSLGMQAVGGIEMLVAQAVFAAEFFTGKTIDKIKIEEIAKQWEM